ncbi:MAG: recombination regulator RecX [Bifidobacteriaceae bacterium]|jgi:regulatory protein|nr:recombination regulator RecX [Bifidobacteriaceae bacterium]
MMSARGERSAGSPAWDAASSSNPDAAAKAIALRLLAHAPKSRAGLAEAMARRGIPGDIAERTLARLEAVGLVDDMALAEALVRSRHTERGLTGPALAGELRRRGLDDETARAAMAQVAPESEAERARVLAARKLAATRDLPRQTRLRRTYALLARKGYGAEVSRTAITAALGDEGWVPSDDE